MSFLKSRTLNLLALLVTAVVLRFGLLTLLHEDQPTYLRWLGVGLILIVGAFFVLRGTAEIIEDTTGTLSERTKLAGGLLQSLGTAFPDMVLGVVAAIISLNLRESDYAQAINYAVIAAATTFGSNIYNIAHAAWCIFRQNVANARDKTVLMFPGLKTGGLVKPMSQHKLKPSRAEIDTSISILTALTILTAAVAVSMVLFGQVHDSRLDLGGDVYQLIQPVGIVIFILSAFIMYSFRHTRREVNMQSPGLEAENPYHNSSLPTIWISLIVSGIAILFAAESMVHAVQVLGELSGIPIVIVGVMAGLIGCLGEMIVVHNFSVNPNGRIGDAIVGVGMDNIVTTLGAAVVAMMGGIFLGGKDLIMIFVVILAINTLLIHQISGLKNYLLFGKGK